MRKFPELCSGCLYVSRHISGVMNKIDLSHDIVANSVTKLGVYILAVATFGKLIAEGSRVEQNMHQPVYTVMAWLMVSVYMVFAILGATSLTKHFLEAHWKGDLSRNCKFIFSCMAIIPSAIFLVWVVVVQALMT